MPVRFAPARSVASSPIARVLSRGELAHAANDHDELDGLGRMMDETTLAALRHFGEYGLRAVSVAAANAAAAAAANAPEDYRYWLGICRALDSRAARRIEASHEAGTERLIG